MVVLVTWLALSWKFGLKKKDRFRNFDFGKWKLKVGKKKKKVWRVVCYFSWEWAKALRGIIQGDVKKSRSCAESLRRANSPRQGTHSQILAQPGLGLMPSLQSLLIRALCTCQTQVIVCHPPCTFSFCECPYLRACGYKGILPFSTEFFSSGLRANVAHPH